jgi:outer membrane lipoprotein SlyB
MSIPKNDTQKRIVVQQKLAKTTQVAERIWLESKLF